LPYVEAYFVRAGHEGAVTQRGTRVALAAAAHDVEFESHDRRRHFRFRPRGLASVSLGKNNHESMLKN
jgi:hypothetical protein